MKFLVIGCGSIGRRHMKNLLAMGHDVLASDVSEESRKSTEKKQHVRTFESTEKALAEKPDAAVICTPPSSHVRLAEQAISAGAHAFIEKPVSNSLDGIGAIAALAKSKGKVVRVGYNLRFAQGMRKLKEIMDAGTYGRALSARAIFAQYLPHWRIGTDYRDGYTGKKSYGGGIILEATHELDYLHWLLGKPKQVACFARKVSSLEVDTEDTAEIMIDFESGAVGNVHLDFVRQDYVRECEMVCEKATLILKLEWNAARCSIEARATDGKTHSVQSETLFDAPWDTNKMYVEEMKAFIGAAEEGKIDGSPGLEEGELALRLALGALESSKKGKAVKV